MNYKEFKKGIKDLDLGLKVRSSDDYYGMDFVLFIAWEEDESDAFAVIKKYEPASFSMEPDRMWMTDDADKRAEFARIVTEFATTPIEEREYGAKTREPRYQVHLGDDLNLINYGDLNTLALDFASDEDTKSVPLLWSEQEVVMAMKEMPNLAWHQCLIDTKKEKKKLNKN